MDIIQFEYGLQKLVSEIMQNDNVDISEIIGVIEMNKMALFSSDFLSRDEIVNKMLKGR